MWRENKMIFRLNENEKKYLKNVLTPFMSRVLYVQKKNTGNFEHIHVELDDDSFSLPMFEEGKYYQGLEEGDKYNVIALGLAEVEEDE
jgi:hypothetical protein